MVDKSSRILLAVDTSNFAYTCLYSAVNKWESEHSDEASVVLKETWETDQENPPELLNYDTFRRSLSLVVQDKLSYLNTIVQTKHPDEVSTASGIDVILALDDTLDNSFRKKLYPEYKSQRKMSKVRFKISTVKNYILDVILKELNVETTLGYKIVKVVGCECDDIIATLMINHPEYMCRIIISSDRDFLQLDNVSQYNMWGEKIERTIKDVSETPLTRSDFLLWKIVRGDTSDNIKNVFPRVGDKKSYVLVQDRDMLKQKLSESNDAVERFKLNKQLIDFRNIPEDIRDKALAVIDEKLKESVDSDFNVDNCMII